MERAKRYRVHLAIRYRAQDSFVSTYAENVSEGGLFMVGAQGLEPMTPVDIEITLPGARAYTVRAQVRHVLDEATAKRNKRKAGAGVMIRESPSGFGEALATYLNRLERREEVRVLVTDESSELLLSSAGFRAKSAPGPAGICRTVNDSATPVIGVVVRSAEAAAYREALGDAGARLVIELEKVADLDLTLTWLDHNLTTDEPFDPESGPEADAPIETPVGSAETALEELEALEAQIRAPEAPNKLVGGDEEGDRVPPKTDAGPQWIHDEPSRPVTGRAGRPAARKQTVQYVGASYGFLLICTLCAAAIGFMVAFLLYFDHGASQVPRRASRSVCPASTAAPAPPRPMAPPRPKSVPKVDNPAATP